MVKTTRTAATVEPCRTRATATVLADRLRPTCKRFSVLPTLKRYSLASEQAPVSHCWCWRWWWWCWLEPHVSYRLHSSRIRILRIFENPKNATFYVFLKWHFLWHLWHFLPCFTRFLKLWQTDRVQALLFCSCRWFLISFFSAPNLRGRSVDHQILTHVRCHRVNPNL